MSAHFLLDTPPEAVFDSLTKLAAKILNTPVSLISILGKDRQFFKSHTGLSEPLASKRETPLSHSFCKHVVAAKAPLVVENAPEHPVVKDNPAIKDHAVIAYLGVPLFAPSGECFGALCAINSQPRSWDTGDVKTLEALAQMVMTEINLRSEVREQRNVIADLQAPATSPAPAQPDFRGSVDALKLALQGVRMLGDLNDVQLAALEVAERHAALLAQAATKET